MTMYTEQFATPEGRAVFTRIWQPNNKGTYSIGVAFPKQTTDMTVLQAKVQELQAKGFNKTCIKDADVDRCNDGQLRAEKYPAMAGCWFVDFTARRPVRVIGPDHLDLTDQSQLYPGCWVQLVAHGWTWTSKDGGGTGVSMGVDLIMVVPANGRPADELKSTASAVDPSLLGAPGAPLPQQAPMQQPAYGAPAPAPAPQQAPMQPPVYPQSAPQQAPMQPPVYPQSAPQQAPVYQQPAPQQQQAPAPQMAPQPPAYGAPAPGVQPMGPTNVFDQ